MTGPRFFARSFALWGAVIALLALLFTLLVLEDESRFGFGTTVAWMGVNFPAQILSMVTSGDVHHTTGFGFYGGVALQWFLIGYFVRRAIYNRQFKAPATPPVPAPGRDPGEGSPQ